MLAALCSVGTLAAQVRLGVEAGVNLSTFAGGKYMPVERGNGQAGYQLGLTADYEFRSHLMLMSSMSFIRRNGDLQLGDNYPGGGSFMRFPKVETAVNYLQLPLMLGYHFRLGDSFSLMPSVGVYAAYGFDAGRCALDVRSGEADGEVSSVGWKPLSGSGEHGLDGLRRWDWGGMAAVKAVVGRHYTVNLSYSLGVMKAQTLYGLRNSTFQLSVGYRF